LVDYLDGDQRAIPELARLVRRQSMSVALRALGDLNSSVEASASELLSVSSKAAARDNSHPGGGRRRGGPL
jgi:hypothetical protein